jgi:hypothetical protein
MRAFTIAIRVLLAVVAGVVAFFFGLFLPLWVMMAVGKDPGNIAGGFLTIGIGTPIGLVCWISAGVIVFTKMRLGTESRKGLHP